MKSTRLQTRFFLFSLVAALSVFMLAGEAYTTTQQLIAFSQVSNSVNALIRNHMQADMMHDDIHGDVLRGILAYRDQENTTVEVAKADLSQHSSLYSQKLDTNLGLELPDQLRASLTAFTPKLEDYKQKAKAVLDGLASPEFAKLNEAFEQSFHTMETSQAEISEVIGKWSEQIDDDGKRLAARATNMVIIASLAAILLVTAIPFYVRRTLFKPLHSIIDDMRHVVDGDREMDASLAQRNDEIGAIAKSLQVFKENAAERTRLQQAQRQAQTDAQEEKKHTIEKFADDFEANIETVITAVASAAGELYHVAENMQRSVAGVGQQSETVATISQRAANNVANVSAAVEEMSASVKEIASQVTKSSGLVGDTVTRMAQADKTTHMLSDAVAQISGILQLIQDIAGQINLLALNATIESARAGEAGKGFAVVASEVKNLASQTTKATEEIAKQIESVQNASREVVEVLKSIQDGIGNVNQYSSGIASAVEEQSAATREISANMQHAALGVQDIAGNISGISKSASDADQTARDVLNAAQTMSQQSDLLKQQISHFLTRIKA